MAIVSLSNLPEIRERHQGEVIVYCSGVFDLPHPGHVLFLEDCKKQGDVLVVGVSRGDKDLQNRKGAGRPIMSYKMRLKMVDALKLVDYCFVRDSDVEIELNNSLGFLEIVFAKLKPEVYVINDDAFNTEYRKQLCEKNNVRLVILERWCPPEFENISTTKLIEKISMLFGKKEESKD